MPMGIVSDRDFNTEKDSLSKDTSLSETAVIKDVNRGRGKGNLEVPNSLRNVIGEESSINGRTSAVDLASNFGISPSSVSAYDVGSKSTASYNQRPNLPVINQAKERIAKRARGKLLKALYHITEDKLESANAKDLAGIAKDMSAVVRQMESESDKDKGKEINNGPTFVFYAPQFHKEEYYEVVQAKE